MHSSSHTLTHALTARIAYSLWQHAGRPEGRDREFWFAAEEELGRMLKRSFSEHGAMYVTARWKETP